MTSSDAHFSCASLCMIMLLSHLLMCKMNDFNESIVTDLDF